MRKSAALGLRLVILAAFAVFFVAPILWLILAPTKSDGFFDPSTGGVISGTAAVPAAV